MAAATVTFNGRRNVTGHTREIAYTSVVFANNGDTLTVPGIKNIRTIDLTPTSNSSYGFTVAANVITLVSGGTVTFQGAVTGL
jgi:hypothetical protein